MLAVDALRSVRKAGVAAGPIAGQPGAIVPAAGILGGIAPNGSGVADLGLATLPAASASNRYLALMTGWRSISVSVVSAPISMPSAVSRTPFISAMLLRSMTALGFLARSLNHDRLS